MSITRRQFFARMRKVGYSRSRMQMARNGVTYSKDDIMVTIPKGHEGTFTITGAEFSGIFVEVIPGRSVNWGTPVDTADLGISMLEVCLGLCSGGIVLLTPERIAAEHRYDA